MVRDAYAAETPIAYVADDRVASLASLEVGHQTWPAQSVVLQKSQDFRLHPIWSAGCTPGHCSGPAALPNSSVQVTVRLATPPLHALLHAPKVPTWQSSTLGLSQ